MAGMKRFREEMNGLHTWSGVICSALLFAMFWTGTLSVFDREIDRWMIPETRLVFTESVGFDALRPALDRYGREAADLFLYSPDARNPTLRIGYTNSDDGFSLRHFDPATGEEIVVTDSLAGTGFIFPFHFSFHITWLGLGYWIAGFLAMAMLVLVVSGIFIHRKFFAEFFVFRPNKAIRRSTLDLHNLTSVIALPFHIMLPFTGLVIFFSIYLPWNAALPFGGDIQPLFDDMYTAEAVEAADEAAEFTSIDALMRSASERWSSRYGQPIDADFAHLIHWGDANGRLAVRNIFPARQVAMDKDAIVFDASGNTVLVSDHGPVRTAHAWLSGLHFLQFDHWWLRWLYFLAGLSGCAMIATGLVFYVRARIKRDGSESAAVRGVRAMTIGAITGTVVATGAFLVINRMLPVEATFGAFGRADLEVIAFFGAWLLTFGHAALRGKAAWHEQLWTITLLALAAVLLNWITTGDHVFRTLNHGIWSVFGMDLLLILSAILAAYAADRLRNSVRIASDARRHRAKRPNGIDLADA